MQREIFRCHGHGYGYDIARPVATLGPNVKITPSETASSEDGTPHEITKY